MLKPIDHHDHMVVECALTPLLSATASPTNSSSSSSTDEMSWQNSLFNFKINGIAPSHSYKSIAIATLRGHAGSISCLALSGEFILSASHAKDIIVWQRPDFKPFAKFGSGDGSVRAIITSGDRVFTAHQDTKIRVWKVSRSSENAFRLLDTLPTTKDYLKRFMKQKNYVQTRRHHKLLWIEHADTISCLAVSDGLIYSGSWDKTLKVWRMKDFKCLESVKAHDDAINGLAASSGIVYSASADGKIKAWRKETVDKNTHVHSLKGVLEGHKDVSFNAVVVSEDGDFVYGGDSDGYVMCWLSNKVLDSWRVVCEVRAHEMSVLCMCLVGDYLCSGSADRSIGVWRREGKGGLVRQTVIRGHEGPVRCLQGSLLRVGGGCVVYSGGLDNSLRVWWVPDDCHDEDKSLEVI